MTQCDHCRDDDPTGVRCTRDTHTDLGHSYVSSTGSHLEAKEADDE